MTFSWTGLVNVEDEATATDSAQLDVDGGIPTENGGVASDNRGLSWACFATMGWFSGSGMVGW